MKAYQLKAAIKNHKPTVWRRCIVPGGITYSQLSMILTEVMGREEEADFEFEFYQKKIRFGESGEGRPLKPDYSYSVAEASEFYIDELLDTEEWFSFYYGDQLKLRVTIEKRLERDSDKDIWPFIVDVKEAVEERVSELDVKEKLRRINGELKKKYALRYEEPQYKTRKQIQKDIQKESFGLVGWKRAENDPDKIRHSGSYYLELMAGVVQKTVLQGEAGEALLSREEQKFLEKARSIAEQKQQTTGEMGTQETQSPQRSETGSLRAELLEGISQTVQSENTGTGSGRISLTERLQWESKDELMRLGKRLGLSGISSLSKNRLAEKAANQMLREDVMEEYFIGKDEESISAWEAAVDAGTCHQPPAEHVPLLEEFYEDHYLAMYEDDSVEVPLAVAEKYKKINTPEFRERRKRVLWMLACLRMHSMIYGVAPASVVMRMYRKREGYRLKQSEFPAVFRDIPKEDNPCELCGDKVISKLLLKDENYVWVEEMQEPWDFFVPEADEIEDCYQNGYPSKERHYQELRSFLVAETTWEEIKIENVLARIWAWTTQGYDSRKIASDLQSRGLLMANQKKWKEFLGVLEKVQDYTRHLKYRGHMPVQLQRTEIPFR